MKKILLMSILTCNFAFAGGQEGTGSTPVDGIVGTSSVDAGEHKVICVNMQNANQQSVDIQCFIVHSSGQSSNNNNN